MTNMQALRVVTSMLYDEADRMARLYLGAAILVVGLGGLLAGLAPLALKGMIDDIAAEGTGIDWTLSGPIAAMGAAYIAALAAGRVLTELRPLLACRAEQRLLARLTQRFFAQLLDLRMSFHLRQPGGSVLQTLFDAKAGSQLIIAHVISSLLPVLIEIATTVFVLIHLGQPSIVLTFCATAAVYLMIFVNSAAPLMVRAEAVSDASQQAHGILADSLLNCEALKCYCAEDQARQRLAASTVRVERAWYRMQSLRTRTGIYTAVTFSLAMAASLLLASDAVRSGTLSIGGFVLATVYMLQIVRPLEMLGTAVRDVAQALGFVRPLLLMLEEPGESPAHTRSGKSPPPSARALTTTMPDRIQDNHRSHVQLSHVQFGYDAAHPVLRDLSLNLGPGRSVGIVGASGSGKSSIIRLLLRLYDPMEGNILLDGAPISAIDVKDLRSRMAVVSQDTAILNDTIARNIALGRPDSSQMEIEHAAQLACLHDRILSLASGYDTQVGERGLHLSGGERQRLAIARALLKRSRLYLFDEATSMLDSVTEAKVVGNLRLALAGCSSITVAHRLSTVMHADEILVLHAGRVAEQGSHQTLIDRNGHYARMWRLQATRSQD